MGKKVDEIVKDNVEELSKLNNYLLQGTKVIFDTKGNRYNVAVRLQMFVDDEGRLKIMREL